MPRSVIILSSSSHDLGAHLASSWRGKHPVVVMTPEAYAAEVHIVLEDDICSVRPESPVIPCSLVSPSSLDASPVDDGDHFLGSERLACILSALALNNLPVVNRPSRLSPAGVFVGSVAALSRRRGWPRLAGELSEAHLGGSLEELPEPRRFWATCLRCGRSGWAHEMPRRPGVYRCRPGCHDPSYEQVLVAGGGTWRGSGSALRGDIISASRKLARMLDLQLCLLTWRFQGAAALRSELVSVDPWPAPESVAEHLGAATLSLDRMLA